MISGILSIAEKTFLRIFQDLPDPVASIDGVKSDAHAANGHTVGNPVVEQVVNTVSGV